MKSSMYPLRASIARFAAIRDGRIAFVIDCDRSTYILTRRDGYVLRRVGPEVTPDTHELVDGEIVEKSQ